MHLISVVVMAIALYTITAMFFGRRSPTLTLIAGVLTAFLIANSVSGGMGIVMDEVGLREGDVFSLNAWTIPVSVFAQTAWWKMLIALSFLTVIGFTVERRTTNVKYCLLMFGGLILGAVFWSLLVNVAGATGDLVVAVSAMIGASAALFPRLRVFLPIIGDTKLQIWMLVLFWWVIIVLMSLSGTSYADVPIALSLEFTAFLSGFVLGTIGKREKTSWKLYRREAHIDPEQIEYLCVTERQKETYDRIMAVEDPFMRDAWIAVLTKSLLCPQCGGTCRVISNKVVCNKGHYVSRSCEDEDDFIT